MKPLLISILLLAFLFNSALCQTASQGNIMSAYNESSNNAYSAEWAVGEIFTEASDLNNYTVTNGLESGGISVIAGVDDISDSFQFVSYPNPFLGTLVLESTVSDFGDLKFNFFNALGEKVEVPLLQLTESKAIFFTEHLLAGVYVISVARPNSNTLSHIKLIRE